MSTETFDDSTSDVFDDTPKTRATKEVAEKPKDEAEEAEDEGEEEDVSTTTGEEDDKPTPGEDEGEEEEDSKGSKTEKMIPESRLKAAIKNLETEHQQKLAELTAKPAPDRETDPDGADLHYRIETSKAIMRDAFTDYDEKIVKYQEMVKVNPQLNAAVSAHPNPAKYAYDLATKQLEIEELQELRKSPDWDAFQKWKKEQKKAEKASAKVDEQLEAKDKKKKTPPNLNRKTDVSKKTAKSSEDDDDLFAGAPLDKF